MADIADPRARSRRAARLAEVAGTPSSAPCSSSLLLLSFSFVDGFGNALNLSFLIGNTLPIALIALPMTLLVVSGEIDLSVGSTVGLSGAVMGALWNEGMTIEMIIPICLLLGVVCGLINGLLVTRLGLPSLAVTIGTLAAYRGIAQIVLGSDSVTDFPTQYLDFASGRIGDTFIPYAVAALPRAARHRRGRAARHRRSAARCSRSAPTRRPRGSPASGSSGRSCSLFVATGLMSSLTGVFWALHYASARYDNATGLELSVVAAVLLGGIDFDGGKGTLGGAIAGSVPARRAAERDEPVRTSPPSRRSSSPACCWCSPCSAPGSPGRSPWPGRRRPHVTGRLPG